MNKKVVKRTIPAVAIALIAMAGLAMAGLLSYYGRIVGTATVKQSLVISSNGQDWKECTGGNYDNCKIEYRKVQLQAGNIETINQSFYIKNNANPTGEWDYVFFNYTYIIPENLFDGLTQLKVYYTTYSSGGTEPATCDKDATIPLGLFQCTDNICSASVPDKLGGGMIQKFCGVTIGLNPATIPDTYSIEIDIIPALT